MAELNVQPKKKSSWLPWLLLALGLIALIFFLSRGCNNNNSDPSATDTVSSAAGTAPAGVAQDASGRATNGWNYTDSAPSALSYAEITDKNIDVRGNNNYGIYGLGENILFDEGKSTIKGTAEKNLKEVAGSIEQRYKGSEVRVFGYTDAVGSAGYNKELAEQRAQAVRDWLVKNGNISEDRISLHPVGESQPVASNATEAGRQQNRRVEIIARATQNQ